MSSYKVKAGEFEGPLDLLLDLIEKRKLHISDVSLANVADDYIEYVKSLGDFPVAESANFILIASTLLLIKSKSLLPTLDLTLEEQESVSDLEDRLKKYKRIKELSHHVQELFGKNILFFREPPRDIKPVFSPDEDIKTLNLLEAIKSVLQNLPKQEKIPQVVVKKIISLEEMIGNLTSRIQQSLKMSFKEFSKAGKVEKVNVIVSFLAMLELVKQGVIQVSQEKEFDDISMETQHLGTPRY
ncbi:MAG: segregation and condensation protein segregation and condensation protein [Candidatus Parcubacteria bacterium]|jgi:segregation and condensation protein A